MKTSDPEVFEYAGYKPFLQDLLAERSRARSGARTALARAMSCQPAYLSRVLNGNAHLSPDQILLAARHFQLDATETRYLLQLLSHDRASTPELRAHCRAELQKLLKERARPRSRAAVDQPLSERHQAIYYSSWQYSAIHMLLTLGTPLSAVEIAPRLGLPFGHVGEVLEFLAEAGIAERKGAGYRATLPLIHLESESPYVSRHHVNWRTRAIQQIEQRSEGGFHHSSVISLAREDLPRVREKLLRAIEEIRHLVAGSPGEIVMSFALDLFSPGVSYSSHSDSGTTSYLKVIPAFRELD